jgi:peptidoglycan-associated lipoprotein
MVPISTLIHGNNYDISEKELPYASSNSDPFTHEHYQPYSRQSHTVSGAPGEEVALEPTDENLQAQASGLDNESVDESALSSEIPDGKAVSAEPINADGSSDSSLPDLMTTGLAGNDSAFVPLSEGQDFTAQSSSTPGDHSTRLSNTKDFRDMLSGEGIEPVPDTFQIVKAETSDSLEDQMNRMKEEELAAVAAGLEDVFFQFDSWSLTPEGKRALERTLKWFKQAPSSNLIIEGHADQRGTQGYNMVLAKKRAAAVQDYLSQLGVSPSRLAIISYGKDKPFCQDATEVCYQLNRRGHFLVQSTLHP